MAAALFTHQRNSRLRDVNNTEQVRLYLIPELGKSSVLNWAHVAVASIIGDDIEPSEGLSRYGNSLECCLLIRHIKSYGADPISVPCGQIADVLRVASCRNQRVAGV